jgi:hypothetical protein
VTKKKKADPFAYDGFLVGDILTFQIDRDPAFPKPQKMVKTLTKKDLGDGIDFGMEGLAPGKWFARSRYARKGKYSPWSEVEKFTVVDLARRRK